MSHLFKLQLAVTVFLVTSGSILWIATLASSPLTDTVTLNRLSDEGPNYDTLKEAFKISTAGAQASVITQTAWRDIAPMCTDPTMNQQLAISTNAPPDTMMEYLTTKGLITSPLCRCLADVLWRFETLTAPAAMDKRVENTDKAFKACFVTNMHLPQQRQFLNDNYKTEHIYTRRTFSKSSLMLIICLSFLFNFIYGTLDYEQKESFYTTANTLRIVSLVLISLVQFLIPVAFQNAAQTGSIIAISGTIIIPSLFVQFGLMEYAWSYLRPYHRTVHIHPYVFSTTLLSLIAIAMFENGVFDYFVLLHYTFITHALTLAYAALLFFAHFNKKGSPTDIHTLYGNVILFAAAAVLIVFGITPLSSIAGDSYGLVWLLPWIFSVITLGSTVYLEHTFEAIASEDTIKETHSHLSFMQHSLLVSVVIGYYAIRHWHVTFGDATLPNAAIAFVSHFSVNFAFDRNPRQPQLYMVG
jgi:hypothetical protein